MKVKIIKYLQKYLPDILWLYGVWLWSDNSMRPRSMFYSGINHQDDYKICGVMLIALAIDIAIRHYFDSKKG